MLKVKLIYTWFAFYKSTNQLIKNFSNLFHLPYVGVAYFASANSSLALFINGGDLAWKRVYSVNIPLGVQLMTKNGFNFSVEGSFLFINGSTTTGLPIKIASPWGAIRLAKNF